MRAKFVFKLIGIVGLFFAMRGLDPIGAEAGVGRGMMPSVSLQVQPILLTDEINRRLSRMGISFNRLRIAHPYDPAGEVC